ncbi:MAG: phosphoglycerate mutase family protein [Wenzhouxiangellaceae bacterium]|nr:phosphoglycerate mutase family protein [Wenzhouxiangellaceae bacterium]
MPLLLTACAGPATHGEGPTVVVVRHAERLDHSADPPLSQAGEQRAGALAQVLARARLNAVYASQYRRTQLTAAPAAGAAGLDVRIAPIEGDITEWARGFAQLLVDRHPGRTVLVVGHSNTVPALVGALCRCDVAPLSEHDYDFLFVVTRAGSESPVLVTARYRPRETSE